MKDKPKHNFLAISGSLRAVSSSTILLQAAAAVAPANIGISLYEGLGDLPHFNPDQDHDAPHPAVADFRQQLRAAHAVLICSPEYAHGVPGVLKNGLDWIVGSGEFADKPTALITTARSGYVRASLLETLRVMMAQLSDDTSPILQMTTNKFALADVLANPDLVAALKGCINGLAQSISDYHLLLDT